MTQNESAPRGGTHPGEDGEQISSRWSAGEVLALFDVLGKLGLSRTARSVLERRIRRCNFETFETFVLASTVADDLGVSLRTVRSADSELRRRGFMTSRTEVHEHGHRNVYRIDVGAILRAVHAAGGVVQMEGDRIRGNRSHFSRPTAQRVARPPLLRRSDQGIGTNTPSDQDPGRKVLRLVPLPAAERGGVRVLEGRAWPAKALELARFFLRVWYGEEANLGAPPGETIELIARELATRSAEDVADIIRGAHGVRWMREECRFPAKVMFGERAPEFLRGGRVRRVAQEHAKRREEQERRGREDARDAGTYVHAPVARALNDDELAALFRGGGGTNGSELRELRANDGERPGTVEGEAPRVSRDHPPSRDRSVHARPDGVRPEDRRPARCAENGTPLDGGLTRRNRDLELDAREPSGSCAGGWR